MMPEGYKHGPDELIFNVEIYKSNSDESYNASDGEYELDTGSENEDIYKFMQPIDEAFNVERKKKMDI
jgi:hypothetical protein